MKIQNLTRSFRYNGARLPDPNATFSLNQVRDFYATVYPEITSADIEGPATTGAEQVYTFRKAVGTKGSKPVREMLADLVALAHDGALSALDAEIICAMADLLAAGGELSPVMSVALAGFHAEYHMAEVA